VATRRRGTFRLLFSAEGRYSQVLLSLSAFEKRTQKTPLRELLLAENRLRAWRDPPTRHQRHFLVSSKAEEAGAIRPGLLFSAAS